MELLRCVSEPGPVPSPEPQLALSRGQRPSGYTWAPTNREDLGSAPHQEPRKNQREEMAMGEMGKTYRARAPRGAVSRNSVSGMLSASEKHAGVSREEGPPPPRMREWGSRWQHRRKNPRRDGSMGILEDASNGEMSASLDHLGPGPPQWKTAETNDNQ